jgi:hypothetical protein
MTRQLALAFTLLATAAFAAEPVFPPGSRIGLVPPVGIVVGEKFQGFHDPAREVIALVRELSLQSYTKVEKEFADYQRVRSYGAEPMPREIIETPGGQAVLFGIRVVEHGVPTRKWALLMRTDDVTGTVILSMPEAAFAIYPEATIRRMLATAVIRDKHLDQRDARHPAVQARGVRRVPAVAS